MTSKGTMATVPYGTVSPPSTDWAALPPAVSRLRARTLRSVAGGDIADLLIPIQWSEVPPLFQRDQPQRFDPIDFLRRQSFDGEGREMLRILGAVLGQPFAVQTRGATTTFVWPVFPVVPEMQPRTQDGLAPWRCVRFADLGRRAADGGTPVHRATVGVDGTWHTFWTEV